MRFLVKTSARCSRPRWRSPPAAARPAATTTASGANADAGTCEDVAIGYFGALTGPAANLGINIRNGAQLAIDQHNEANADCKVTWRSTTPRATRTRPPAWRPRPSATTP